jgi:hypothetical protein
MMRGAQNQKGVQAFAGRRESEKSQPPNSLFRASRRLKGDRPFAAGRRGRIK